jgi:hypothetical protein
MKSFFIFLLHAVSNKRSRTGNNIGNSASLHPFQDVLADRVKFLFVQQ